MFYCDDTYWIMLATACLPAMLLVWRGPAAVYEVMKLVPPTNDDWNCWCYFCRCNLFS